MNLIARFDHRFDFCGTERNSDCIDCTYINSNTNSDDCPFASNAFSLSHSYFCVVWSNGNDKNWKWQRRLVLWNPKDRIFLIKEWFLFAQFLCDCLFQFGAMPPHIACQMNNIYWNEKITWRRMNHNSTNHE